MTEEEALGKWCPFARYASRNGMAINRWADDKDLNLSPDPAKCIGSACMAWRWREDGAYRIEVDAEFRRAGRHKSPTEGFCGLAGSQ